MTKTRFVCGVDFGTTFTSVAFAHSSSPNEVKLVLEWPNGENDSSAEQVPSELLYLPPSTPLAIFGQQENHPLSSNAFIRNKKWGYEIPSEGRNLQEPLRWFKLLLQERSASVPTPEPALSFPSRRLFQRDSSQPSSRGVTNSEEAFVPPKTTLASHAADKLEELGIEPVQAITDFLAEIRKLSVSVMINSYGAQFFKTNEVEYILTIPAIWSDSAKDYMIRAATGAGYGKHRKDFNLVSEPEAAAAYTLEKAPGHSLEQGNTFIVCDAGGGTVDLISYEITGLNPLSIDESVSGTGDLCGSVFLNQRFEAYIRNLLGNDTVDKMRVRSKTEMFRTWEEKVKFKFGNTRTREFAVSVHGVPDDEEKNIEEGFHVMLEKDVKDIFDPVINKIVDLVRQQAEKVYAKGKTISAIILVGGFGCSPYLLQALKDMRVNNMEIEVLSPPNARTAIARGALQRGLDGSIVKEQIARRHYGVACHTQYNPNLHGPQHLAHREWHSAKDMYYVVDHMIYFVHKGNVVNDAFSKPIDLVYHIETYLLDNATTYMVENKLYVCEVDDSPEFKWQAPSAMSSVCTVEADIINFPMRKFPRQKNSSGEEFYQVDFQLKLTVQAEVTTFEILHRGQSYGHAITRFK